MTTAGMGGFAKGFASGFVTTFNARNQQDHEKDQLTLKSRLDALREDSEARKKKQEAETQYLNDGKALSEMMGDPTYAPQIANLRRSGISSDGIMDMFKNGNLVPGQKPATQEVEMRNPDLVSQNKMAVPAGVNLNTGVQPDVNAVNPVNSVNPVTPVAVPEGFEQPDPLAEVAQNSSVSLGDTKETQAKTQQVFDKNDGPLKFVPNTKKTTLGTLADELYKQQEAQRTGDTLMAEEQKRKVDAIKTAEFIKANEKAKLEGTNLKNYAILDKNGRLTSFVPTIAGPNGEILNASTDNNGRQNPVSLSNGQRLVPVTDEQVKQSWNIKEQFSKQSKDYNISAVSTAESVSITRKMTDILDRNPSVTTDTQGIMVFTQGLFEEAKAMQKVFEQSDLVARENFKPDGDPYKVSSAVATMDQKLKELELQKLSLSDKNAQDALDKTIFDNYKTLLAYKLAMANGQSGQAAGEKDIQRFLGLVGDKTKSAPAVKAILANQLKEQIARNDTLASQLNTDVEGWGSSLGFIPDIKAERLGNIIKDPNDRKFFDQVNTMKDESLIYTNTQKNLADGVIQTPVVPEVLYKPGQVVNFNQGSFTYKGGDPKDQNSWEPVK